MKHQSHRRAHTDRRRTLRGNSTDAERLMWQHLRKKQILNTQFRRQHGIDSYIVDFVSLDAMLVIELDGGQHQMQQPYDERRDQYLRDAGFQVLRFWNNDVLTNPEGVITTILTAVATRSDTHD